MSNIRMQIEDLFDEASPPLRKLVIQVLKIEQEFIHMGNPRGVMERIDGVLDRVAKDSLEEEGSNET